MTSTESYGSALNRFTEAAKQALSASRTAIGLDAGERRFWASVLFTRLCTVSMSILWLCPGSEINADGLHWDFSSVASLARSLFETEIIFFYLCIEPVTDDEWHARLRVMQLHDCTERSRMFRHFDPNDSQLPEFHIQADELRALLAKNPFFAAVEGSLRKALMKGVRPCILTQDEILQRMGALHSGMRGYYRFLSSHAHWYPLAFYRMAEQGRGHGVENDYEKRNLAVALEFCADLLTRGTHDFQQAFQDLVLFVPHRVDLRLLKRRD